MTPACREGRDELVRRVPLAGALPRQAVAEFADGPAGAAGAATFPPGDRLKYRNAIY